MTLADLLAGIDSVVTPGKRRLADLMRNPLAYTQQAFGQVGDNMAQFSQNALRAQEGQDLTRMGSVMGNAPQYRNALSNTINGVLGMAPVGMMIGPKAKTWDSTSAAKAMELEKAGVDPRAIWKETGTWKGPDGQWRQELPDNTASFRTDFNAAVPNKGNNYFGKMDLPVGGAINHPSLFQAYPDLLSKVRVELDKRPDWMKGAGNGGEYKPWNDKIRVANETESGALSTFIHELQHAIQKRENFTPGGNAGQAPVGVSSQGDAVAFDWYRKLAGEAEARATQARIPLNAIQRRAIFPLDSYDVPLDQLISK